jgi:hypothetical protein
MKFRKTLVAAAILTGLAVPATASAGSDPVDPVLEHAKKARSALHEMAREARNGQNGAAARSFRRNVRQTDKAVRAARRVYSTASGRRGAVEAADALQPVIRLEDKNVEVYAGIVDEVSGALQEELARALAEAMTVRQVVFDALTELVADLPARIQEIVATTLAKVFGDHEDEIGDVEDAIDEGVPPEVEDTLTSVLDLAFDFVRDTLDELDDLIAVVPEDVRPIIESTFALVSDVLDMVENLLDDLLGGGLPGLGGGLPGLGGGLPGLGGLDGVLGSSR